MRLASETDRIHRAGAEVIAVSVDDEVRQAGMFARWPTPHIWYAADPDGQQILRPLGLFNPDERGGVGLPAMLVLDPDGNETYRYIGRDFADRTVDDEVYAAVESLGLDPIEPPPGGPAAEVPDDLAAFFRPKDFVAYFRGSMFAGAAVATRVGTDEAKGYAREHREMCEASLEVWRDLMKP